MRSGWMRPLAICVGMALLVISAFTLGNALAVRGLLTDTSAPPSGSQLVASVREALAEPNELTRGERLAPLLQSMQAADLESVVGAYEETFPGLGPGKVAMQLLCERWAQIDPQAAARHISGWRSYWERMALAFLMRSWARIDASAAREALEDIEIDPTPRKLATAALLEGWADSGAPNVWEGYVAGLPFGFDAALEFMSKLAGNEGLDRLVARVEALPDESGEGFKRRALQVLVVIAIRNEPERALAVVERYADTPSGRGLRTTLGMQWVVRDGPSTMAWLLARSTELELEYVIRSAYQRWLAVDADAALEWAIEEPAPQLIAFLDLYAVALAERDPQRAAELAESVESESRRSTALRKVAESWRSHNPTAANRWFEERGLVELVADRPRGSGREARAGGGLRRKPEDE